ncbi:uncharacterized protein cal1 [Drosophila tropicalis]|uniref:uncharacterized protein cal1 n=1 Tax=Drosophila tropicalis TaxID=46794 RepID=UPI0035ABD4AE
MSSHVLVNEETLESMVFERSKKWSNFIEHFSEINDDENDVVDFDKVETLWKDDEIMDDASKCFDEAQEDKSVDANMEIPNVTSNMAKADITQMLCPNGKPEEIAEVQEILNQTLPILEEHKRKWKEAGLDRILNTFDVEKIEQHVGQWLRRNNSVYMDKSPVSGSPSAHDATLSDNESLHSVDTARYIRQSRKRNPSSSTSVKCSTTSTIKMYRTQAHKRDELRAKYAAHDDEQEHRHHLQALLRRRRERERDRELSHFPSPRHCRNYTSNYHHKRRKHVLRHRPHSSMYYSSSSGDEDFSFCNCKSCCVPYKYCSTYRSHHDYRHLQLGSRSMYHMRRQHAFEEDVEMDLRPRVLESECSCCNSERLCSNVIHLANSSTEEWVVKNDNSPIIIQTPKRNSKPLNKIKKTLRIATPFEKAHKEKYEKISKELLEHAKPAIRKTATKRNTPIEKIATSSADQSKKNLLKKQAKVQKGRTLLPISEEVIISSKPVPKSKDILSLSTDTPKDTIGDPIEKQKSEKTDKHVKTLPNIADANPIRVSPSSSELKSQRNIKKSAIKKTGNSKLTRSIQIVSSDDSDDTFAQVRALPMQSIKPDVLERQPVIQFNNQSVACNSTALANDSAYTRSLQKKQPAMQQAAATVSSTCNTNSSSVSPVEQLNADPNFDADCTIVTSTTCCEPMKSKPSPIKLTNKGILLHDANSDSGHFTLTESSLSKIIGQRRATQFLKFHVGSRSFDGGQSVYYRPTPKLAAALSAGDYLSHLNTSSSSSSDDDIFDRIKRYGEVYSVLEKPNKNN